MNKRLIIPDQFRMNASLLFRKSALCLALSLAFAVAPSLQAQTEEMTEMEERMDIIQDGYRTIGRGLRRPDPSQLPEFIKSAETMKEEAVKCKELVPLKIKQMPEDQQAEAIKKYKAEMDVFIATLEEMKTVLEAGDFEQANVVFDKLKNEKSEGHEEWKTDD